MADMGALMSSVMHMIRLIWGLFGVIKYLHWKTNWFIDSIIDKEFSQF